MYVNLPILGILLTTSFWLNKHNDYNKQQNEHILHILNVIIRQNYFQHEGQIFQPEKGIVMGFPLSNTIAEIYLQYFENIYIKHWLDSKEIVFYKRYVDGIIILYDQQKTDRHTILQKINEIDKHLQFKISTDVNNTINYLDIHIHRSNDAITIEIYRKPTEMGTVIHLTSNHPFKHKTSAFLYYIN